MNDDEQPELKNSFYHPISKQKIGVKPHGDQQCLGIGLCSPDPGCSGQLQERGPAHVGSLWGGLGLRVYMHNLLTALGKSPKHIQNLRAQWNRAGQDKAQYHCQHVCSLKLSLALLPPCPVNERTKSRALGQLTFPHRQALWFKAGP